jgi:hypothetical protein
LSLPFVKGFSAGMDGGPIAAIPQKLEIIFLNQWNIKNILGLKFLA